MYNRYVSAANYQPDKGPAEARITGGHIEENSKKPLSQQESGGLQSIRPEGIDTGDVILLLMLLLLYMDSRDEEFLIILIILGLGMLRRT